MAKQHIIPAFFLNPVIKFPDPACGTTIDTDLEEGQCNLFVRWKNGQQVDHTVFCLYGFISNHSSFKLLSNIKNWMIYRGKIFIIIALFAPDA
jgi:hypothetical protein